MDIDIIFMDHMMPDVDGIEATKAIRSLGGALSQTPIIALTANAISGAKEKFLESGNLPLRLSQK
jgi:CheY-like chemotaxis protein